MNAYQFAPEARCTVRVPSVHNWRDWHCRLSVYTSIVLLSEGHLVRDEGFIVVSFSAGSGQSRRPVSRVYSLISSWTLSSEMEFRHVLQCTSGMLVLYLVFLFSLYLIDSPYSRHLFGTGRNDKHFRHGCASSRSSYICSRQRQHRQHGCTSAGL